MHDRKREVLQKAQELFAKKGISATSVQDIIETADISKGTFYNYFPSKNACIISILELVQNETIAARNELLIGADHTSAEILVKQVQVRMQTNEKYSLFSIFQSVFHSKDKKLISFIKRFQHIELAWLTRRLIEVFGEKVTPYATDCAIVFYGIIQHFMSLWSINTKENIDATKIINYAMRRLQAVVNDVIEHDDRLLGDKVFLHPKGKNRLLTKDQIIERLNDFKQDLDDEVGTDRREFVQFLLEEFERKTPRSAILEPIIQSLRNACNNTPYELQAQHLTAHIWQFIQQTD